MEPVRRRRPQALPPPSSDVEEAESGYEDDDAGDVWPARLPSSALRYQGLTTENGPAMKRLSALSGNVSLSGEARSWDARDRVAPAQTSIPRRRSAPPPARQQFLLPAPERADFGSQGERHHGPHWLLVLGLLMLSMLLGWVLLTTLSSWWQVAQDDWHYGRPRTYHAEAVVGHHDSATNPSHFIALNLHSHVEVIEFPGGDASKARIYLGPTLIGPGEDLAVVTLTFKDVNGDGKLDMIVNVEGSHFVFLNDQGQFHTSKSGEQVNP
jgi:hypothetical protein